MDHEIIFPDIVVQSFYALTFNKLQQKCSQVFLVQKNVLFNILKVSQNLIGGNCEKFAKIYVTKRNKCFVQSKNIFFGKALISSESTFSDL